MPLLLEADPSEALISGYLNAGELYALMINGNPAAVAVVLQREDGTFELKNLAVDAPVRGRGYGSRLVRHLCRVLSARTNRLWVGTSPANAAFYERFGFVRVHAEPNYFPEHYEQPIVEGGGTLTDRIVLVKAL